MKHFTSKKPTWQQPNSNIAVRFRLDRLFTLKPMLELSHALDISLSLFASWAIAYSDPSSSKRIVTRLKKRITTQRRRGWKSSRLVYGRLLNFCYPAPETIYDRTFEVRLWLSRSRLDSLNAIVSHGNGLSSVFRELLKCFINLVYNLALKGFRVYEQKYRRLFAEYLKDTIANAPPLIPLRL